MTTPASPGDSEARRIEAIGRLDQAAAVTIFPGLTLRSLVAAEDGGDSLMIGLLTVDPGTNYPTYTRPFTEALMLLEGDGAVDVEARRYRLQRFDSAALPRQIPRRVVDLSPSEPAVFLVALASNVPLQTWVNARFDPQAQPLASKGREHAEWISRGDQAAPWEFAPRARFQEICGGERDDWGIRGGIGRFEPGARLPCCRVDGAEAITIVEGTATCIVEGRTHTLATGTTLFVPPGLCHYPINLTLEPLVLIWVHAGGRATRTIVDDNLCHPERQESRSPAHS
jgi:quercetin dioxygenase-like cupin family protein